MKVFSITTGKSRIEFSVWKVNGLYEARVNEIVIYKSPSYSDASNVINEGMESNNFAFPYIGGMTH